MKNKNGVTLIALVVTIVVLIILAGISIATLTGNNSIIKQAGKASNESEIAKEIEMLELTVAKIMDNDASGNIDKDKLQEELNKSIGKNRYDIYEFGVNYRVFIDSQRWYEIDGNGVVTKKELTGETDGIYIAQTKKQELSLDGAMVLSPISSEAPSTQDNLNYMWTSSTPSVATVSVDGIVMCGTEIGTTTITCKGANTQSTCEITTTAKIEYENNTNSNRTINGEAGTYQNPTIPNGYYALTTNAASWNKTGNQTDLNNGLCVMDKRGNQFVWIPVPDVVYDGVTETIGGNYTPMAKLKNNSNTNYEGILYTFDGTTATISTVAQNKEPISLNADLTKNDDTKGCSLIRKYIDAMKSKTDDEIVASWDEYLQDEYNKFINSVSSYGGFWISRYEISYDLNQNKVSTIAGVKPTKAEDEITKTWYGLNQSIKSFATGSYYKSTMVWGSGFDAMLNWMIKNGISVGVRVDSNGVVRNRTQITGNPQYNDKVKNIFDLIGCTGEWTYTSYARNGRCVRAHAQNGRIDVSYGMGMCVPQNTNAYSSRITLYME